MTPHTSDCPADPSAPASASPSKLQQLEHVLERDRRNKLLLIIPVAGVIGAAATLQASWVLAIAATGLLGTRALLRNR